MSTSPVSASRPLPVPLIPVAGTRWQGLWSTLAPLTVFAATAVLILFLSRVGLMWAYRERLIDLEAWGVVLGLGMRFDLIVIAVVCSVPLLVNTVAPVGVLRRSSFRRWTTAWLCGWLMLLTFNEAATPAFMAEFGVRPNRQYVEYLGSPGVVIGTLWTNNRASVLLGMALTGLVGLCMSRWLHRAGRTAGVHGAWGRAVVLLPLLVVLGYTARGSVGHRPLSVSNAAVTTDPTINDLALNSTYSAAYAIRQLLHERKSIRGYGSLSVPEVLERVRAGMQVPVSEFTDPARPTSHVLIPTQSQRTQPNLVVILEESLGAQYFESLGGLPVARELEYWRSRSFWFENLYATGTRSARGIEAVVAGFPPTRTSSVIKLEGAQHNFFTIARVLQSQGYRTQFIYGGDASFDNMRRFFVGNGFESVIDQADLSGEAAFTTTWGVSDQDLFGRVDRELREHDSAGRPFFTLVFTTSNHPPYEFPDGQIELYENPKQTHRNAARYADFATASYLQRARRAPYWSNTVFLVVADHESRSIGDQLVPIFSYRIPGFITGGPVQPRVVSRLASQLDLLPTVLSLMGQQVRLPATGMDQSRTDLAGPGQAVMQFNENMAYRVGEQVIILAPHQPIRQFRIAGHTLVPESADAELSRDALAHALLPIHAYREGWYR